MLLPLQGVYHLPVCTLKNRLVDSCSKWDESNPEWKFPRGCARSISKTFSRKIGSKAIQAKRSGTNGMHTFHSEISFGNFGLHFKKSGFHKKVSSQNDKINLSICIPSEISRIFWVNGKQP